MNLAIKSECEGFNIPFRVENPDDRGENFIVSYKVPEPDIEAFKKQYPDHKTKGKFSRKKKSVFPL